MTASRVAWTILVPFCVLLALLAVLTIIRENSAGADDTAAESGDTVQMVNIDFEPTTLTVASGSEVLFDNNDVAPHTVTADDGSSDSGVIDPGKAYKLVVDDGFSYHCELHPSMTATIEVEG